MVSHDFIKALKSLLHYTLPLALAKTNKQQYCKISISPSWTIPISVPKIDTIMANGNSEFKGLSPIGLNESLRTRNAV